MAKDDKNRLSFITPRTVTIYPHLLRPDTGTKENPKKPEYNVKGRFTPGEKFVVGKAFVSYEDIVTRLEALRDEEFEKQLAEAKTKKNGKLIKLLHKAPVFNPVLDGEGEETGEVTIRAKTASEFKDKDTGEIIKKPPPTMFDAKGVTIAKLPQVGGGSEMKIGVFAKPYFVAATGAVGISYYLEATQLLKLVKYTGGRSAESMGFGSEEGYSANEDVSGLGFGDEGGDSDADSAGGESSSDEDF